MASSEGGKKKEQVDDEVCEEWMILLVGKQKHDQRER